MFANKLGKIAITGFFHGKSVLTAQKALSKVSSAWLLLGRRKI